ncbi:hypothetical protein SCBWM1_gp135 [Synechococcus phage S-CBWM1]|uniref:Uncharacterized protein n=1 Tax=Synechococcus phage S-CBWM1 TaxID=2053653 RepID=A0A3G1L3R5_9CAUD|nr:hypothetical protein HOU61_gp062 [Synechococcus phage S-CBWM1]ATW62819.1 hypothetical protein SCBWM1_gp135 [Synechococcus phage S-CBWM1]
MAKEIVKLGPEMDPRNLARLESRNYDQGYTKVPNSALPAVYQQGLSAIFQALTGETLDPTENTFAVKADNGIFKRLYAPAIFAAAEPAADEEPLTSALVIVWGDRKIPLSINKGEIYTEASKALKNVKYQVRDYGNFNDPSILISVTQGEKVYSYPFVVRPADINEKLSSEEFEIMVEEHTDVEIAAHVQTVPSGEGGSLYHGHFVKVSQLPIGSYTITGYRSRDSQFGKDYFLQAKVDEPFSAPVRMKQGEEWVEIETEIQDWCIVRPNSAMKKTLGADPVISEEVPATLHVLEHFSTSSGHPAAKVSLQCTFGSDDGALDLAF